VTRRRKSRDYGIRQSNVVADRGIVIPL